MKHFKFILPIVLLIALAVQAVPFTSAENTKDGGWQADILKLMSPQNAPKSTSIHYDLDLPEDAEIERKTLNQELVSSRGDVLNVEFRFALNGITFGEGQWATVQDWLKSVVLGAVQNVQADSESLANVVAESYQARRAAAEAGETGLPAWANEGLLLEDVAHAGRERLRHPAAPAEADRAGLPVGPRRRLLRRKHQGRRDGAGEVCT